MLKLLLVVTFALLVSACQTTTKLDDSLYHELGGKEGIAELVGIFIYEIGQTEEVLHHFKDTDIDRFREKLIEHICLMTGGPCAYTGDEMIPVHQGMNVSESEFNATTDALIRALNKSGALIATRNRLLAIVAPLRSEIIYH